MAASTRKPRTGDAGPPRNLPAGEHGELPSKPETPTTQARAKSWRDVLPVHPAAELFPLMSEAELRELGEDIKKNKLSQLMDLWHDAESGKLFLLDGRNRLDAMELGGALVNANGDRLRKDLLPMFRRLPDQLDPYAYVISANIRRRHLTGEQKRDLIGKLLEADPAKSDREIGRIMKADNKTVASVRAEKRAT
jgi:hypothetical protein